MIDVAMYTNPGGRENNEDYVREARYGDERLLVLCDGLGGHDCGEVASRSVAEYIGACFEKNGNSRNFLPDAINGAQQELFRLQAESDMANGMKTTLVVLVVTDTIIKWAHIGDSRLYHIYDGGDKYERTKDHSLVQLLCDTGEIKEEDMRHHPARNKVLRVMGAPWRDKSFDLSAVLERDAEHAFILMTDGFWELIEEEEMLSLYKDTDTAVDWLDGMRALVAERAGNKKYADNYSAICVRTDAN